MANEISVIICTHNPRTEYLQRTLDALRSQSLDPNRWELLLIDNRSVDPVDDRFDVTWHPNARVLRENELGLTPARLRGIRESGTETLCFVDDDNVLDHRYLEKAVGIADGMPHIGCWGGEILGDFETSPPGWFKGCEGMLVIRPLERDMWGNAYRYDDAMPCGAGLCVRRTVVTEYLRKCELSPIRKTLDRSGTSMASAGDLDMAYTAIDMGMGTGRFKSLQMLHLIPAGRLQVDYLARLAEGMAESDVFLHSFRCSDPASFAAKRTPGLDIQFLLKWLKSSKEGRRLLLSKRRGRNNALKRLRQIRCSPNRA